MNQGLTFIEVMAGFQYTIREMNVMRTVAYLNEIVLGVGFCLSLAGIPHGFHNNLLIIEGNMNAQCYRDEIFVGHIIPLFQTNAYISLFQHDNATSHTAWDTVNFLRANNIALINNWPAKNPDLNPLNTFGIIWISMLDIALFHHQTSFS